MKKTKTKSEICAVTNFRVKNLTAEDMEILLSRDTSEKLNLPGNRAQKSITKKGIIICSFADTDAGMGNLLVVDFNEVIELGRGLEDEDDLYIITKTTEGPETSGIFDFITIFNS